MSGGLGLRWDDLPLLRDRAVSLLLSGPAQTPALAERVLGIRHAPAPLADSLIREILAEDPRFQTGADGWFLRDGGGAYAATGLEEMDYVVVDVEATGGSPARGDRVTEVAAVRVSGGRIIERFESLINPERPIPPSVTALTNITDAMVVDAPRFTDLVEPLQDILSGAVFVAHNASFDWRFLETEFRRCQCGRLNGERLCTLRLARRLHPELRRRSLRVLVDYYSIPAETWHRAGPDALATAELFVRFLSRLRERGVTDWGCLQAFLKGELSDPDAEQDEGEEIRH